jgi:multidrug efflux pump subunit AcrA (membrane-fusion protein)
MKSISKLQSTWVWVFVLVLGMCATRCAKKKEASISLEQAAKSAAITQVVGVGRIEPEIGLLTLYAGVEGRIISRLVQENELVFKGRTIMQLDASLEDAQVVQASAKIATQRAAVKSQLATLVSLKTTATKTASDLHLTEKLLKADGATQQTLTNDQATARLALQNYQKGQQDVNQARTTIAELETDRSYSALVASKKTIKAPYDGQLLEWSQDVGNYVVATTAIGQFAPAGSKIARTEIDELFADKIQMGQRAEIRSQANGKIIAKGKVYFMEAFLKKKTLFEDETTVEDRRVREVKIRLDPGANVLINNRVDCIIYLK